MAICTTPGCPTVVERGRCQACQRVKQRLWDDQRGSATARGYGKDWQYWRRMALIEHTLVWCGDRPTMAPQTEDSGCRTAGRQRLGKELDHIAPISGRDDPRRFDPSNVQLLCPPCHAGKRSRESREPPPLRHQAKAKVSSH
jgi:5-methylcytosine-specific restriction protein A